MTSLTEYDYISVLLGMRYGAALIIEDEGEVHLVNGKWNPEEFWLFFMCTPSEETNAHDRIQASAYPEEEVTCTKCLAQYKKWKEGNKVFRVAEEICREHGFDPEEWVEDSKGCPVQRYMQYVEDARSQLRTLPEGRGRRK